MVDGQPVKPDPTDPTVLTTSALHREIATLRESLMQEVRHLDELTETKFDGLKGRLDDLAVRTAEQKTDTKEAVTSAFNAAREAFTMQAESLNASQTKTEATFSKQIDAAMTLISSNRQATLEKTEANKRALDEKIDDLKGRLDRIEGRGAGLNAGWVYLLAAMGAIGTMVSMFVAFR